MFSQTPIGLHPQGKFPLLLVMVSSSARGRIFGTYLGQVRHSWLFVVVRADFWSEAQGPSMATLVKGFAPLAYGLAGSH